MRIFVKAKPGSGKEYVERIDDTHFTIWVREAPERGLANLAITKALADHLGVSRSALSLIAGFSSRQKVFQVEK